MSNYIELYNKVVFHPGYYLKEYIDEFNISLCDLANASDVHESELISIINGEKSLDMDIASKLANYMGTSIDYWMNLQHAYDTLDDFKGDNNA